MNLNPVSMLIVISLGTPKRAHMNIVQEFTVKLMYVS